MLARLSQSIRFGISPVFFFLAWVNAQPSAASHASFMSHLVGPPLMIGPWHVPSAITQALLSMWLMYALMGVAHLGPWLALAAKRSAKDTALAREPQTSAQVLTHPAFKGHKRR
ncbi:hypothetical protein [Woodsholea maritima]|uniref:hypothetical protein n=1 Tax=Woodsholea maritima TaxID=240237 RepID=UPI00037FDD22|nr:hypothetical protein [Woodsholea maritima]